MRAADSGVVDKLINAAASVGEFFVNLGDSIADFFEGIGERIKEGWTFVLHKAEQAFEFICALGDKVKRFVLDTLEQVGSFFSWLCNQIKLGLEKLWDWLKFIFSWKDILRVRDAMVDSIDEALHYLQQSITPMKANVTAGFDYTLAQFRKWRADAGGTPALPPVASGQSVLDDINKVLEPVEHVIDQISGNSAVAWVMNKLDSVAKTHGTAMFKSVSMSPGRNGGRRARLAPPACRR